LTVQRGLEASIAQGLKLDAVQNPRLPNDPVALKLLRPGPSRAGFWFSRVLLLQALTIRYRYDRTVEVRELVAAGLSDEHVFVREVAERCLRALDGEQPDCLLFEDLTDATGRAPRGEDILTAQLIGDIVLALNLNEYGDAPSREAFGTDHRLPHCLDASRDRREVIVYESPRDRCPFASNQENGGCLCPYTFDAPEPVNRRELSRAFCRHLRMNTKRPPWQSDISVKDLKRFWRDMEDLAQF
jgi:hypothetical protein